MWEYKTVRFDKKEFIKSRLNTEEIEQKLNSYAEMGWELFSFKTRTSLFGFELDAIAIFKRKVLHT